MAQAKSNYQKLQIALFSGSCFIILLYTVLFFGRFLGPGELLGTSPINLIIAGIHAVYFTVIRIWFNQTSPVKATVGDLVLFSLNIVVLLLATGGFRSVYFTFWLFIILLSAALGRYVVGGYVGITVIYLAVSTWLAVDAAQYLSQNIIHITAVIIAGLLGVWLWRHHPPERSSASDSGESQISDKLQLEQIESEVLLRSIGDGVIVVDTEGKLQLINGPAVVITGWPQDEALGLHYEHIIDLEDEEGNTLKGMDEPIYKAIHTKSSVRSNDLVIFNRGNRRVQLSFVASPIFSGTSKVTGAIGVFRDISEEKAAARQRDEFISTASHEMRTPVAAIEGFLALAMNPKVSNIDENAKKYIEKAHQSTQHLGKLFQDLLSVTKLEDGRLANHPKPFELGKVIRNSIDELRFKAEQKNLDLKLKASQEASSGGGDIMPLYYVNADPERIREVFTNLVDNAIKFTPEGEVNVSIGGDDKQVTVGIHDQGVGIPKDEISHLFQKFYRVDNSSTREIGGTGLGLFLCRTIIELYNGKIWVESEEGKGSDFYFSLPRLTYSQAQEIRSQQEKEAQQDQDSEKAPGESVKPAEAANDNPAAAGTNSSNASNPSDPTSSDVVAPNTTNT